MSIDADELLECLERWASWAVKRKRFPKWEYEEIISEGWILIHGISGSYDQNKSALYTWTDRVLSYRLPEIYKKQTKMRVWKAGEGTDSIGRASRPTTPYIDTISINKFFDDNLGYTETQPE